MSGDNPTITLGELRRQLGHWQREEVWWHRREAHAARQKQAVAETVARLKAQIAAAEADQGQRIVTEDDGGAE